MPIRLFCNCIKGPFLKMNNTRGIKTFVFLDIETTGLPQMENNQTKITELCMVAVEASHIQLGVFPRVQNKLNLCFNPRKLVSLESEEMTGLSNTILEHQCKFSSDTVKVLNSFLDHNQQPLCLVAHNGNFFDFPILRKEIEKTGSSLTDEVLCIDSLPMFKQMYFEEARKCEPKPHVSSMRDYLTISVETTEEVDVQDSGLTEKVQQIKNINETTPKKQIIEVFPSIPNPAKRMKMVSSKRNLDFGVSFKLSDIYSRLIKRSPIKEHQAEGDVMMLIMCASTLGDNFLNWANANATKFCDIPLMVAEKKIGT
ncbi:hypothetical protein NQ315_000853 [Exocentrus adspersus]|uniref:Exonuclease domain-containing protein n=1 Tax=Exocentrus adspersus TaxID=1586481 RepID=A0AAV8WED2_9CUCU|nr:hypothetical protein NQ315_000853 [Exocentrus adspersus]